MFLSRLCRTKTHEFLDLRKVGKTTPKMGDRFLSSAGAGGNCACSTSCQTPAQYWIKIVHPWVQKFYPVLGLGSGDTLLWHFQTPVLYWINFSLRQEPPKIQVDSDLDSTMMGARQRSGEGVVRRNGCPKGCFWRVRFFSAPLRFSLKTPERS